MSVHECFPSSAWPPDLLVSSRFSDKLAGAKKHAGLFRRLWYSKNTLSYFLLIRIEVSFALVDFLLSVMTTRRNKTSASVFKPVRYITTTATKTFQYSELLEAMPPTYTGISITQHPLGVCTCTTAYVRSYCGQFYPGRQNRTPFAKQQDFELNLEHLYVL